MDIEDVCDVLDVGSGECLADGQEAVENIFEDSEYLYFRALLAKVKNPISGCIRQFSGHRSLCVR